MQAGSKNERETWKRNTPNCTIDIPSCSRRMLTTWNERKCSWDRRTLSWIPAIPRDWKWIDRGSIRCTGHPGRFHMDLHHLKHRKCLTPKRYAAQMEATPAQVSQVPTQTHLTQNTQSTQSSKLKIRNWISLKKTIVYSHVLHACTIRYKKLVLGRHHCKMSSIIFKP